MKALVTRLRAALSDPNPIVRKELLAVLRSPLYVRAVVVTLVLLGLVVVSVGLAAGDTSDPTEAGRMLFQVFFGGTFLAMALVGPSFGATAIVQEREGRTLDALILTGMTPGRIVAGKLAAVFLMMAFLPVVSVPMLAVVALFGGIGLGHIVVATAYVLAFGALSVAFGLAVSSQVQSTRMALLGALPLALGTTFVGGGILAAVGHDIARRHALAFDGPFFFADAYFAMPFDATYGALLGVVPAYVLGCLGWLFGALAYAGLLEPTQDRTRPLKAWALGAFSVGVGAAWVLARSVTLGAPDRRGWALAAMIVVALVGLALGFSFAGDVVLPSRRMEQERLGPVGRLLMPPTLGPSVWFVVVTGSLTLLLGPMALCGIDTAMLSLGLWASAWLAAHVGLMGWMAARRPGAGVAWARTAGVLAQLVTMVGVWLVFAFLGNLHRVEYELSVLVVSPAWAVIVGADRLLSNTGLRRAEAQSSLLVGAGVYALAAGVFLTRMELCLREARRRG